MPGRSEGSFSYTLGLGLLMGRAGRHRLIREGDYERALACYRLSESLYRSAGGARTNQAQSWWIGAASTRPSVTGRQR